MSDYQKFPYPCTVYFHGYGENGGDHRDDFGTECHNIEDVEKGWPRPRPTP